MATKPWRPLRVGDDTGRFTRKQIEDAIRAVEARNQAAGKNGGRPPHSSTGTADRGRSKKER